MKMSEVIPMFGIYERSHCRIVCSRLFGAWLPLCRRAIIYIRVHGGRPGIMDHDARDDRESYVRSIIHFVESKKPESFHVIYGIETCAGSLAAKPEWFFDSRRWSQLRYLALMMQRESRSRETVFIHESASGQAVAENERIIRSPETLSAYDLIKDINIWHDFPVARFSEWFSLVVRMPQGLRRWKLIGPVPGFYDPDIQDHGSRQWNELQAHKALGTRWIPRVFASSNGRYGGSGALCFDARRDHGLPSRNLRKYLSNPHSSPVIIYPGYNESVNVATAMKEWYDEKAKES